MKQYLTLTLKVLVDTERENQYDIVKDLQVSIASNGKTDVCQYEISNIN